MEAIIILGIIGTVYILNDSNSKVIFLNTDSKNLEKVNNSFLEGYFVLNFFNLQL